MVSVGLIRHKYGIKSMLICCFSISAFGGVGILIFDFSTGFFSKTNYTHSEPAWIFPFLVLFA